MHTKHYPASDSQQSGLINGVSAVFSSGKARMNHCSTKKIPYHRLLIWLHLTDMQACDSTIPTRSVLFPLTSLRNSWLRCAQCMPARGKSQDCSISITAPATKDSQHFGMIKRNLDRSLLSHRTRNLHIIDRPRLRRRSPGRRGEDAKKEQTHRCRHRGSADQAIRWS